MATGLSLKDSGSLENMSKIIIASAIANVEPAGPANQLVSRYDIPSGSKQVNVPIWKRNDAAALTEGVDISVPQQLDANVVTITGDEHGILIFVSDRLASQNNEDVLAQVGTVQGNAVGRLLDTDLVTLYASLGKTILNNAEGSIIDLAGAVSYLRTNNDSDYGPAYGELNAVLHPEHIRRLAMESAGILGSATAITAGAGTTYQGGLSEDVVKNYYRGTFGIFGVSVYEDGNITTSKGGVFQREAFALAMESEIEAEQERDASLRGTEVVMTGIWKEKEVVDAWGVLWHGVTTAIS